ncbi:para-aminobenzoate synthetase component 1 [Ectothiorhodospira magna]|uniref:aminodeoxychorismate synthase n=1 Tax=Ectothiorhodospira magna TaxID=867345 RepID=A0A1H9CUZ4_9GAMM|nr:aminodeoxychorismate synthase component I [Ectothiorhodospira magna]SEQ04423.1 para-aminobenzoate synthetase component 1 [Ectothiorhodospira magna]
MCPALLAPLPYLEDSSRLFDALEDEPWAVLLDSTCQGLPGGRYDILTADPYLTVVTQGDQTQVRDRAGRVLEDTQEDPFQVLRTYLGPSSPPIPGVPFAGGAVGYFGYDLAQRLERLPVLTKTDDDESLPQMMLGLHDWAVVVDHEQQTCVLVGQGRDRRTGERWEEWVARFSHGTSGIHREGLVSRGPLQVNLGPDEYHHRFDRVQAFIREGDCYQVNLARRFQAPVHGDPWGAYCSLRTMSPAPFGAFFRVPGAAILCNSPERFLHLQDGRVTTCPIKGTRPRGQTASADASLSQALADSAKDRAENVMIVDLLRHDLGKVCAVGSVAVPTLFAVQSYATVHHLVSTVTGQLAPGQDGVALLRACFPGGSITGAPKIRAMEIIELLEPHRREVYCGAMGYLGFDGAMDTNVAIRTLVHQGGRLRFWAGGGITSGSQWMDEYQETLDKAAAMLRLFDIQESPRHRR